MKKLLLILLTGLSLGKIQSVDIQIEHSLVPNPVHIHDEFVEQLDTVDIEPHSTEELDNVLDDLREKAQRKKYAEKYAKKIELTVEIGIALGTLLYAKTHPQETSVGLTSLLTVTGIIYGAIYLKERRGYRLSTTEETFLRCSRMVGRQAYNKLSTITP